MGKSAPKPPDFAQAAKEQAVSSRDVTEQQTWANRPDQVTPFGSQRWTNEALYDPTTGQNLNHWTQHTDVAPELQHALESQLDVQAQRSDLADSMMGRAQNEYGKEMDWNHFTEPGQLADPSTGRQRAEDALYAKYTHRLDPQMAQEENSTRTRLYNQGLREGDQAFDNEMGKFNLRKQDAYDQARTSATTGGMQEAQGQQGMDVQGANFQMQQRQQQISEEMQRRGFSLNEINAILTGQQIGTPQMPSFNTAQRSEGVQSLQAAQMQGQANLDAFNATQQATQGLMSGAGSMAMGFSDRRLKTCIRKVGEVLGVNLYKWKWIFGGDGMGVMADEVGHIPGAVHTDPRSGYLMVDYGVIYGR